MIVFIDDEPDAIRPYVEAVECSGLSTRSLASIADVTEFLSSSAQDPQCVVLDIMFPTDTTLPLALTGRGLRTGLPLFASLRSRFPNCPVIVFTSSLDSSVTRFFGSQANCWQYFKPRTLPSELANAIRVIVTDHGGRLLAELARCSAGRLQAKRFESAVADILEFVFVPPLKRVLRQTRRSDGHTIRDIVLPNDSDHPFWLSLRTEFKSRHVVAECKNYVASVGKKDVGQLREYLSRPTIGRFGILVARQRPSPSALTARRDAYSDDKCLILFVDDGCLAELVNSRRQGKDPSDVLLQMKQDFELAY